MAHPLSRKLRVYYREILIRLKTFRFFLVTFFLVTLFGSLILQSNYELSTTRAIYEAITLMFFASTLEFPSGNFMLEMMWILYPTFGLILLADGLTGIGVSLRFGDRTSVEWNKEMAKLMHEHIIVVGIGNLGLRVLDQLVGSDRDVVIIDKFTDPSKEELIEIYQREHEFPVVKGDASMYHVLQEANIESATALMILIDDDLLNLKIAIKARKLNPNLDIIMRFYDMEFGAEITKELDIDMLSTSKIAVSQFLAKID